MRAERVITALLQSAAGVTALVGSGAAARIYGNIAPQEAALPLVVYSKRDAVREPATDITGSRIVRARVDVMIVARTYAEVKALGEQCRLAIVGTRADIAGVTVLAREVEEEGADEYEPQLDEHAQTWTFRVHHME